MDEKIKNLWINNKVLFFILIPLIAVFFLRNIIIDLLISGGHKALDEAKKKSDELKNDSSVANTKANQIIEDANKASENKPKVTEDWNK